MTKINVLGGYVSLGGEVLPAPNAIQPKLCMKLPTHWKTKDKRSIAIKEMDDAHLQNTIAYLIRCAPAIMEEKLFSAFAAAASFDSDSMASYYADCEIHTMENENIEDFLDQQPMFRALTREAKRRKLPDPVFP